MSDETDDRDPEPSAAAEVYGPRLPRAEVIRRAALARQAIRRERTLVTVIEARNGGPARTVLPVLEDERPRTRGDCADAPRPCPWVSCRHHLYLDVRDDGAAFTIGGEVEDMEHSCALDLAERGGLGLKEIATVLRTTRQRVQQIEIHACRRARLRPAAKEAADLAEPMHEARFPFRRFEG